MPATSLSLSSAILSQGADVHSTLPGLDILVVCSRDAGSIALILPELNHSVTIFPR